MIGGLGCAPSPQYTVARFCMQSAVQCMLMPVLNSPDDVMHGRPPLATSHSDPNYPGFKFGISDENRSDWLALMHAHNTQHAAKVWEVPDDLNAVHKQAVPLESKASPALRSSTKKQNAAKAVTDTAAKPAAAAAAAATAAAAAAAADASAQKGKRASSTSSTSSNGGRSRRLSRVSKRKA